MGQHATNIAKLKLVKQLEKSAGRDDIDEPDIKKLTAMVFEVADTAGLLLSRIPVTFKQYTEHDISHCYNLIDLMGKFIPKETLKQLNGLELTIMILVALLHDFGMFVSDEEKEEALRSESFRRFMAGHQDRAAAIEEARRNGKPYRASLIEDAILAEYFRRLHPQRVEASIQKNLPGKLIFRDVDISRMVSEVCESHGWGVQESNDPLRPEKAVSKLDTKKPIYGVPVNLQYIACCLRLADVMDFDRSRTPMVVFQNIEFTEQKSWEEWNKHLQITGWIIDEREVAYGAECKHPAFYVAVMEFLDWIDAELRQCRQLIVKQAPKDIAERYQLHLPPVVERWKVEMADKRYIAGGFRFQLEYERIMQLLMDKSLYPDPSLFLRELLQNSLDACRNREALAKEAKAAYTPRIVVWDYSGDEREPRIIFQDNGMGMTLRIVENYFMRVGRSYYRSGEFEAERQRLKEKNIDLEATSQFGIGILSCFMVADRFEVETYRTGSNPLHVTIEGPTKYFTIEKLDPPAVRDFYPPAESDIEDGPPTRPGTRITVHLREGVTLDPHQVLETFAVNIEYDIRVYKDDKPEPQTITRRRWETEEVRLVDYPNLFETMESPDNVQVAQNLSDVLAPTRIPFEKYEFLQHLRGNAWFWLLRGDQEQLSPARGYLKISGNYRNMVELECIGLPAFISAATPNKTEFRFSLKEWEDTWGNIVEVIKGNIKNNVFRDRTFMEQLDSSRIPFWGLAELWDCLSDEERQVAIRSLEQYSAEAQYWISIPGLPCDLLKGKLESFDKPIDFHKSVNLSVFPQQAALHGIYLPAGLLEWNPMTGHSNKLPIMPGLGGGVRVDAHGIEAPTPAASRLFVDSEEARNIIIPVVRAALRHASELAFQGKDEQAWRDWSNSFLREAGNFPLSASVIAEELEVMDISAKYLMYDADGNKSYLSRREIITKYGRWIPLYEYGKSGPIGLVQYTHTDALTAYLLVLRNKRQRADEVFEVDLESTISVQGASLDEAYTLWLKENEA